MGIIQDYIKRKDRVSYNASLLKLLDIFGQVDPSGLVGAIFNGSAAGEFNADHRLSIKKSGNDRVEISYNSDRPGITMSPLVIPEEYVLQNALVPRTGYNEQELKKYLSDFSSDCRALGRVLANGSEGEVTDADFERYERVFKNLETTYYLIHALRALTRAKPEAPARWLETKLGNDADHNDHYPPILLQRAKEIHDAWSLRHNNGFEFPGLELPTFFRKPRFAAPDRRAHETMPDVFAPPPPPPASLPPAAPAE